MSIHVLIPNPAFPPPVAPRLPSILFSSLQWTTMHVILCDGELRMFQKEKQKLFRIVLRCVLAVETPKDSVDPVFSVTTPSYVFWFRCRHVIAAADWVNSLRRQVASRERPSIFKFLNFESSDSGDSLELIPVTVAQHGCYIYGGKPLLKNIWVGLVNEKSGKVKKKKKIKKPVFVRISIQEARRRRQA